VVYADRVSSQETWVWDRQPRCLRNGAALGRAKQARATTLPCRPGHAIGGVPRSNATIQSSSWILGRRDPG